MLLKTDSLHRSNHQISPTALLDLQPATGENLMSDFGLAAEAHSFDRSLTQSESDEAKLVALGTAAQLAADTMDYYNDTGEFDEALAALASVGVIPQ